MQVIILIEIYLEINKGYVRFSNLNSNNVVFIDSRIKCDTSNWDYFTNPENNVFLLNTGEFKSKKSLFFKTKEDSINS